MKTYIIQHATKKSVKELCLTKERHKAYCDKFGFEYVLDWKDRVQHLAPQWGKLSFIYEMLNKSNSNDLIIWLDSDCIINKLDFDLSTALPEGYDIGFIRNKMNHYNTGVMFLKNSDRMKKYIKDCIFKGMIQNQTLLRGEQFRMNHELRNAQLNICELDSRFNNYKYAMKEIGPSCVIKAFHGEKDQLQQMMHYLNITQIPTCVPCQKKGIL